MCAQGYFCDGTRRNAVSELLSLKDANCNDHPELFFPRIDIITPPLRQNFVSLSVPEPIFFKKQLLSLKDANRNDHPEPFFFLAST
jgi:hypothetical protein